MWRIILIALPLAGCVTTDREWALFASQYYTRADVDAINAHRECLALARNYVQVQRCEVRR